MPVLQDAGRSGALTWYSSSLENYPECNSRYMERPWQFGICPPFVGRISYCWKLVLWLIWSSIYVSCVADGMWQLTYLDRQFYRIKTCLDWLEESVTPSGFWPGTFSVMDISLLCSLLFADTRNVFKYRDDRWPKIVEMIDVLQKRKSVIATEINQR